MNKYAKNKLLQYVFVKVTLISLQTFYTKYIHKNSYERMGSDDEGQGKVCKGQGQVGFEVCIGN